MGTPRRVQEEKSYYSTFKSYRAYLTPYPLPLEYCISFFFFFLQIMYSEDTVMTKLNFYN